MAKITYTKIQKKRTGKKQISQLIQFVKTISK